MRIFLIAIVIMVVVLEAVDSGTTMFSIAQGCTEKNQMLAPIASTCWLPAIKVSLAIFFGFVAFWLFSRITKFWQGVVLCLLVIWATFTVKAVINNVVILVGL